MQECYSFSPLQPTTTCCSGSLFSIRPVSAIQFDISSLSGYPKSRLYLISEGIIRGSHNFFWRVRGNGLNLNLTIQNGFNTVADAGHSQVAGSSASLIRAAQASARTRPLQVAVKVHVQTGTRMNIPTTWCGNDNSYKRWMISARRKRTYGFETTGHAQSLSGIGFDG